MKNLRNLLIVCLSILMVSASAQFSYTDATAKAHEAILQLNFKTAEQITTNQVGQSNGFLLLAEIIQLLCPISDFIRRIKRTGIDSELRYKYGEA